MRRVLMVSSCSLDGGLLAPSECDSVDLGDKSRAENFTGSFRYSYYGNRTRAGCVGGDTQWIILTTNF
jgi:hypothetical protein